MIPTVLVTFGSIMGIFTVARGKPSIKVISGMTVTPRPADTSPLIASISSPSKAIFG